ncbi:DUF748 domain-containing protein [Pseudodesulfovibrio portus]|uniref:Flagellar motor protein MotB n=1 Tax=Pseudodesulfovibrio portus TaxID=231439 RepID=A0ABM8AUI2_9BACT|nr:DUF748 domain-containing protein [Pseudodesulfovibrio portus]BDQ34957.1 flagellar motor protein MotB [Pseudodesulfovibrio portus]
MLKFLDKIPFATPRLRRWGFWLLAAFVCYVLFGFFALPPILKDVLVTQLSRNLNRPARVGEVYFNPLLLHLEVTGLAVSKLDGEGDLISAGKIIASPSVSTLWHFAPVISYLHLKDLALDITFHGNGHFSVSDLMDDGQDGGDPREREDAVFPFALYDFELTNASLVFDDRVHDKRHVISDINMRVPFTSSIEGREKEFTQPKFTAVVNGDPVELKGRTLPFDRTLLTEFELGAVDISLDQYWRYVPVQTPLTLKNGRFTSDISLFFQRPDAHAMSLFLGGGGKLTDLELEDPQEGTVIRVKELAFDIERFSLKDNFLALKRVAMQDPYFKVVRAPGGSVNWGGYFQAGEGETVEEGDGVENGGAPFRVDFHRVELRNGSVEWIDRAVPGGYTRTFGNLEVTGAEMASRGGTPGSFEASVGSAERLSVKGTATLEPLLAHAKVTVENLSLPDFTPYLAEAQPLAVDSGVLAASADVAFAMEDGRPDMKITGGAVSLTDLAARKPDAKEPSVTLAALNASGATLDLAGKSVDVDKVAVTGPMVTVTRERDGKIDLQTLFTPEDAREPAPQPEAEAPAPVANGWNARIRNVSVEDGAFTFLDRVPRNRASLGIRRFKLDLKDLSTEDGASSPYSAVGTWTGGGSFATQGKATLDPITARGRFTLTDFGLRPLDAYLADTTELLFAKGRTYANLEYSFSHGATPRVSVKGDAALAGLSMKTTFADTEFVGLDRLDIKSIDFRNEPLELVISEINLDGPRALVEYAENGRLNIRRALRLPEPPPMTEENAKKEQAEKKKASAAATADDSGGKADETPLFARLDIGRVSMKNGTLHFRDASVHPLFTNEVGKMTLTLTDIGRTVEARPKIDFTAEIGPTPVSVTGVLNPVVTPIYSDLSLSVNGMELVPLTPYTVKNLAYPIEKGRLYADVTFKTEDWKLDARNKFFIEQLVLGPKDKRPDAPNVPVKFGLALLQDDNGDLELDLPITGRLDDPNFRIGGIVFRAIVSMLFKALASPFTLIGSIFGGGGENMDFVVFEPGRARLDQNGEAKMATVIKALTERDRLKLEVDGVIDPAADANGLAQVIFERKIKEQKYLDQPRSVRAETTVDDMVVKPEEYEEYLFEAYADEPDEEGVRPTTLFMVDEQPVEVMEKFIRDRIVITDTLLHELAMRRANAVKSYIVERNPALAERVFLLDREDRKGRTGVPAHRADLGIN